MNKSLFVIFSPLAILTLFLGWSPRPAPARGAAARVNEVSYCSLLPGELKDFASGIVKTRVLMAYSTSGSVDGGDSFFYSPDCNNGDFFAVENSSNGKDPWAKLSRRLSESAKGKEYVFELKLKGRMQTAVIPTFGHLGWSRNELEILEIEDLKDVTSTVVKPDRDAETPLSDRGDDLKNTNLKILEGFAGGFSESDIAGLLADDFIATDPFENKYTKQNYPELIGKGLFAASAGYDSREIGNGSARLLPDGYKVSGFVAAGKAGKKQKLIYENIYRYKNNAWIAIASKFSNP